MFGNGNWAHGLYILALIGLVGAIIVVACLPVWVVLTAMAIGGTVSTWLVVAAGLWPLLVALAVALVFARGDA